MSRVRRLTSPLRRSQSVRTGNRSSPIRPKLDRALPTRCYRVRRAELEQVHLSKPSPGDSITASDGFFFAPG